MRRGTVVIADDFEAFRRFVCELLLQNGFQVIAEASNGLEAVTKVWELQPDLVILDISMPSLNGIEAAAQIRSIAPECKILFLSSNPDPDVMQAALNDGAAGYVQKSAMSRDLLPAVEACSSY